MAEQEVPPCDAKDCTRPATHFVETHEAEPMSCDEHDPGWRDRR